MSRKLTYKEKLLQMGKRQKKSAGKHVFILLAITLLFIIGFEFLYNPSVAEVNEKADSEFSAAFVGDMMFGRHVQEVIDKHGAAHLFENVQPFFEQADYVTGNFEQPVLTNDEEFYEKLEKQIHLHAEPEVLPVLKDMDFTVLNLANNHAMDYGEEGLQDTLEAFDSADLSIVGAGNNLEEAMNINYQEHNGIKVATLGFTDVFREGFSALGYRGGILAARPEYIFPAIEEARENADLVFVHVHWGQEYDNEPHPRQRKLARAMVDVGADVIIGHHSHVLSEVEQYNNGAIFYGLGNFIFDQGWTRTKDSAIVQYDLLNDGTGRFEIVPLRVRGAQPYETKNKYYQMKIRKQLTINQPNNIFDIEDGRLIIEVDHSDVLEKRGSWDEQ